MKVELQCGDTIAIPEGCKAVVKDGIVTIQKEVQEFKDGDMLVSVTNRHRYNAFIYKSTDGRGFHSCYIGIDVCGQLFFNESLSDRWCKGDLSYATEEEKQILFDKMKERGLCWNADEKRVEKIRWRAEDGEGYFCVDSQGSIMVYKDEGFCIDGNRHEFGNYFRTHAQAIEAAKRMKEVLRKYHEEIEE